MANVDPFLLGLSFQGWRIVMTHALSHWLGRFFSGTRQVVHNSEPSDRKPMQIEVEALPDYLWRELGFQQVRRPDE